MLLVGALFPLGGMTMLAVLALDRFVIPYRGPQRLREDRDWRKIPTLSRAFASS